MTRLFVGGAGKVSGQVEKRQVVKMCAESISCMRYVRSSLSAAGDNTCRDVSNFFFIIHCFLYSEPNSEKRLVGKLFLFSGKSGDILKWQEVPDKRETYFSPVVYSTLNGTNIALFGTGGETHAGSLWAIDVIQLYHGNIHKAVAIYTDEYKGTLAFTDFASSKFTKETFLSTLR